MQISNQISLDSLIALFENFRNKKIGIFIQPNPDPDAMASAACLASILDKKYESSCEIIYNGDISHPQNQGMCNLLHLPLNKVGAVQEDSHDYTIVVDTDISNVGLIKRSYLRIDHHLMDRGDSDHNYIKTVGSTCSLIVEICRKINYDFTESEDLATALALGIKTDTSDFCSENSSDLDYESYKYISQYLNRDKFKRINNYTLPISFFEHEALAFNNKIIKNSILVTNIGNILSQKRDDIAIISDKFIRIHGISTVIVMAIVDDSFVASVRSIDPRVEVLSLCKNVFGKDFSGAKDESGGAKIPLSNMFDVSKINVSKSTFELLLVDVFKHFSEKVYKVLGEE